MCSKDRSESDKQTSIEVSVPLAVQMYRSPKSSHDAINDRNSIIVITRINDVHLFVSVMIVLSESAEGTAETTMGCPQSPRWPPT